MLMDKSDKDSKHPKNQNQKNNPKHTDEIEGLHTKIEDPFEKLMRLRRELAEMDQ